MQNGSFAGVRIAQPEDGEAIFNLLLLLYRENALSPINENKVRAMIARGANHQGGIIGVIDGKTGLEATVGMVITQQWYTDAWHIEEMWTFVRPDCRKSSHAKNLIKFMKWASDNLGIHLLTGILTTTKLEPKMRLMQRQMPQVGAFFIYGKAMPDIYNQRKLDSARVAVSDPAHPII